MKLNEKVIFIRKESIGTESSLLFMRSKSLVASWMGAPSIR